MVEIGHISGIENLAPRTPLSFGSGNIALIYGPNGSGKSGYTRILKRASGNPRAIELKSNAFEEPPLKRQCRIVYRLAGKDHSVEWQATGQPIDALRSIDIFDADTAAYYLSQETASSYEPPAVTLFYRLVRVCDEVKERLQVEQDQLVSKLPDLPSEYASTDAGTAYRALTPDLDEEALQLLTHWREDDQKRLEGLTERLRTVDPESLARQKRSTKVQLDQLAAQVRTAATSLSQEHLNAIRELRSDALAKRRIATESFKLDSAQLDGIGTDTWNALWQAARLYSQTAYPGRDYPVTDEGSRCVLCHQRLARDAGQRLRDFEAFVQGEVEAEAMEAEVAFKEALNGLPTLPTAQDIQTQCEAAGLTEEGAVKRLRTFWQQVADASKRLKDGEEEELAVPVESPDALLREILQSADALEREAVQLDEDAKALDRDTVEKNRLGLEARRWTSHQAAAIHAEVALLKQVRAYEEWKKLANSRNVSRKVGDVAERVITQAFVDRFNRELKALGASQIKVELAKTRTEKGKALHRLLLKGTYSGHDLPESVLSEGERRIVALAAFLADVAKKPHATPFIFDDPISSLDHDFEWQVATRLAQLAQSRQVLVFTHRLSLYGGIEEAAKKIGNPWKEQHLHQRCIEMFSGVAGHPADEEVWIANTKKANDLLLMRLSEAKRAGESDGAVAYKRLAQGICSDFRKLLERTVEDDLLNKVVKRHRRSVTTHNRLGPLPSITPRDCKLIDDLMTKYSRYEHSQSEEVPSFLPEEQELREDLEALKTWRTEFTKRPRASGA